MSALNWTRVRKAGAPDVHEERRRAVLKLGASQILARARALYRACRRRGCPVPFCRRCIEALAARRFGTLCTRCLFRIGMVRLKARPATR